MVRSCLGYPGNRCGALITGASRCGDCQRALYRLRNAARPPGERQFYSSAAWRKLAAAVVAAADGRCQSCGAEGVTLTAGHRVSIRLSPGRALDPSNLRAECRSCQNRAQNR
jgi:5-methylcytosine-specific restriction endonuclease McrA